MTSFDAARLAAIISPLRRALMTASRTAARLPDVPDAQVDVIRALPRCTAKGSAELAAQLRLSRSTVSNLLGSMESVGLVERTPDSSDRRRVVVRASERALDLFARFDAASAALITKASDALDDQERIALADALPALERLCDVLLGTATAEADAPAPTRSAHTKETGS